MKPQPVFTVQGVVASVRPMVIEPREASADQRAFDGARYTEVDVICEESLLGDDLLDVPSVFTMRVPYDAARDWAKGTVVDEKVTIVNVLMGRPGRWYNDLRFRPVRYAVARLAPAL